MSLLHVAGIATISSGHYVYCVACLTILHTRAAPMFDFAVLTVTLRCKNALPPLLHVRRELIDQWLDGSFMMRATMWEKKNFQRIQQTYMSQESEQLYLFIGT